MKLLRPFACLFLLLAIAAGIIFLLPPQVSVVRAQGGTPTTGGCYQYAITSTAAPTLVYTNNGGAFVNIQWGYYTSGTVTAITTQLAGGYVLNATSAPFNLGSSLTNTTSADGGSQSGSYTYWYINTTTLTGGGTQNAIVCISNAVTKQSLLSTVPVSLGGTGIASGTSGGVLAYTASGTLASSAALTANSPVLGGGAGVVPSTIAGITSDGTSVLNLGVAGTSVGGLGLRNATSGTITLNPPTGALGTVTLTAPAATATLMAQTSAVFCGTTTTCSATAQTNWKIAYGEATLTSATPSTAVVASIPAFTSTATYECAVTNQTTQANSLKVAKTSTTSITITGPNTVTDVAAYFCWGT